MFLIFLGVALAATLTPDDAVAAALVSHPDLARAEAELSAAQGAARASAFLRENPEIEGGYAVVGDRLDLTIAQPLSLTGEGLADHRSQRARVDAAEAALHRARLTTAAETRAAYIEAALAHTHASLAAEAFALASRQLSATEARLRVGEATDLDFRLARLEQAASASELLAARSAEATALATLSGLIRQPVEGEDLAADLLAAAPAPGTSSTDDRSDVRAARLALQAAEAAVSRERAAVLPRVSVGGFYEDDAGQLTAGPTLGVTLPIWQQNQSGIAAAKGEVGVARAELDAAVARAEAEQRTARAAHTAAVTDMAAVPATPEDARLALVAIEAGVRSGELDLSTAILFRDEVVAGQRGLAEAQAELALARIHLLLATEDDALLGGASP